MEGFEYATYNDAEDLKRVVKRINRWGRIRSLFGRPRRAVAAIMMEALQVSRPLSAPMHYTHIYTGGGRTGDTVL